MAQNTDEDSTQLKYPFPDQSKTDPFGKQTSPLFGREPSNIEESVEYDPETNTYKVVKKIGNLNYTYPETMTVDEYRKHEFDNALQNYWGNRWKGDNYDKNSFLDRKFAIGGDAFETIFGANTVEIHPQGSAELIFGLKIQKTENPALPEKLRRTTTFDFKEKIQMNVTGKIGDRLNLGINYDTEATFDFENKMKLAYEGKEDDIIQKIEAGDVTLPLSGSLISGSQSLFGFKTELKFGKLTVTSIFSQQEGKRSEIEVQGGAQVEEFEVYASEYEVNKHFFLSQYFYENYDAFLENTSIIKSPVQITKIEVWVTNKTGNFEDTRNIVAFMDLAEGDTASIYNNAEVISNMMQGMPVMYQYPSDTNNSLSQMKYDMTNWSGVNNYLQGRFTPSVDYEKVESARMLKPAEYTYNPQLGYISLNSRLSPDEVLAVAFEYTAGGKTYRVGEFSNQALPHPAPLVLKLLKGTSASPKLPRWKLMMKNIYALGAFQLDREDFELHVLYKNDNTGTAMNYIDVGDISGEILLNVMGLDRLNTQNDPIYGGDGTFDFIEGITINQSKGRIIFPVVEPFGNHLRASINNDAEAEKYTYDILYSETQNIAEQEARKNKFVLKGKYQASSGSEISLNALNVPQGSVTVSAGGQTLTEGQDYTVDYTLGRVKILNQGLLESGTPIKISLESNSLFSIQKKTLLGSHLDYKFSDKFTLGGTILNLSEKPMTAKVNQGEEPINNTIWGLNGTYQTEVPILTKIVDAIPFIDTKEASNVTVTGEFAHLIPGHSKAISDGGLAYIDDFEGSTTKLDQKYMSAWSLASIPRDAENFPYALETDLKSGYNRAKLAWYVIDPILVREQSGTPSHLKGSDEQKKVYVKEVYENDLWPNKQSENGIPTTIPILNVAFYPKEKGPYNYDPNVDNNGYLNQPQNRWAGIQRELSTTDFEESNIEYIEFWMMDPFFYDNGQGRSGDIIFNLGDVSEDVLKDSRKSFEEGLPTTAVKTNIDTTGWGYVSSLQSIVFAFDNDPASRSYQDVGYDGLSDTEERSFFSDYINQLPASLTTQARARLEGDPSSDNYHYYRGTDYDNEQLSILKRYKFYNGAEGNSPTSEQSPEDYTTSATTIPNNEDINRDYTLNEGENFFQYKVHLFEGMDIENNDYIVDKVTENRGIEGPVNWYQFRIPIRQYDKKVGEIYDFKSIRFMRMILKNFSDSVILRFATIDLVRGQWRKYNGSMRDPGAYFPTEDGLTNFEISAVNIEENGSKEPVNYVLPPGVSRVIDPNNPTVRELNEQAMVYKVENLTDGDAKAAYKNSNLDIRQYKRLEMFVHAEEVEGYNLADNDLTAFIRLGSDFTDNYYEYEIPLKLTPAGRYDGDNESQRWAVWPEANMFNFYFSDLTNVKTARNNANASNTEVFSSMSGQNKISVKGNPTISDVRTIMIGIRNPKQASNTLSDDGMAKTAEIWFNELRLAEFDEQGGWAANMRVAATLADFANVSLSGSTMKPGFGSIEKKVSERNQDDIYQYDVASNVALGKFFPEKAGISIPMYVGYSKGVITPKYNPLQPDITMEEMLNNDDVDPEYKKMVKDIAQDQTTRKSINFTNVKVKSSEGKPKIYSVSNWSATYAYNKVEKSTVTTEFDNETQYRGVLSYNYSPSDLIVEPFKKSNSKFMRSPSLKLIKDFNFSLLPKQISFMTDMNRRYHEKKARILTTDDIRVNATYDKDWQWNRKYDLKWDITRSLKLTFNATNIARIDEPAGSIEKSNENYEANKQIIYDELKGLGTTKQYKHSFNLNYTIPINKIPLLNWISASYRYGGDYYWTAGPKATSEADFLGNVIRNSRNQQLTAQANFKNLYNKVTYFKNLEKKYNSRSRSKKPPKIKVYFPDQKEQPKQIQLKADEPTYINHKLGTADVQVEVKDSTGKKINGKLEVLSKTKISFTSEKSYKNASIRVIGDIEKEDPIIQVIAERTILALLGVKNLSVSYTTNDQTVLSGYVPRTTYFGTYTSSQYNGTAPGWPFIFGHQDENFLNTAQDNHWLTANEFMTSPYTMVNDVNVSVRSNIEPIDGLRIDLTATYRRMKNTTTYYAIDPNTLQFADSSVTNYIDGSYAITINTWSTAFERNSKDYSSAAFNRFKNNRAIISQNLGKQRKLNDTSYDPGNGAFANGYSEYSQDVLIQSFYTAYTGKDAGKIDAYNMFHSMLSLFPGWRVSYDGLSKLRLVKQFFRTVTLNHNYQSTYNIGSYRSNSSFVPNGASNSDYLFTDIRDITNNYIMQYDIQSTSISEQFSPLIGIDMSLKNSLNFKLEYKKSRNLTLNIANIQVTEVKGEEFIVGAGYRFKSVTFRTSTKEFKSDLNTRLDFSIRDNITLIRRVIEDSFQPTAGQKIFTFKFNADYSLSQNFNVRFFFDWITNEPKVSNRYRTSNINFGLSVRFSLS
ncbi:MAG: cell surface protein SprA [Bacteroidales bacterium]|nr:cell surface protein SprA [Bacteroidales bacterium]